MSDHHQARCNCGECQRLDRTPVRKQGIPGAWQASLFAMAPVPVRELTDEEFDELFGNRQKPPEGLPLFSGLDPQLF